MTRIGVLLLVCALMTSYGSALAQSCGHQKCISNVLVDSGRKIRYTNNCERSIRIMTARFCNGHDLNMRLGWGIPSGGYWDQDSSVSQCSPLGGNTLRTVVESACLDSPPDTSSGKPTTSAPELSGSAIQIENQCKNPMKFVIHYLDLDEKWQTDGIWQFASGATKYLSSSGKRLQTNNSIIYVYVEEVASGGYKTKSAQYWSLNGRRFPMDKLQFGHEDQTFKMSFSCPDLSGQGRGNTSVTNRARGMRGN